MGDRGKGPVGPRQTKACLLHMLLHRRLDLGREVICSCPWSQTYRLGDDLLRKRFGWPFPDGESTLKEVTGVFETDPLPGHKGDLV